MRARTCLPELSRKVAEAVKMSLELQRADASPTLISQLQLCAGNMGEQHKHLEDISDFSQHVQKPSLESYCICVAYILHIVTTAVETSTIPVCTHGIIMQRDAGLAQADYFDCAALNILPSHMKILNE
jgi:hypothetical protein